MMTQIKTVDEIAAMRESGRMLATVLDVLVNNVEAGMSTKDLSQIAKEELRKLGGQPSFLGYYGYPDVLCVSVNDEVVHGIPRPKHLINEGDIVSLDFGVTYKGMITDAARSIVVGKASVEAKSLLTTTKNSLDAGIRAVRNGCTTGDIGAAIQAVLDQKQYGIIRDLVGHGVGHQLHEDPNIPNHGKASEGERLVTGMTIAIEPMATLGGYQVVTDDDNWTIRTADHSLAAHFEDTVLIIETGSEILTRL